MIDGTPRLAWQRRHRPEHSLVGQHQRASVAADQADGSAAGDLPGEPGPHANVFVQMDQALSLGLDAYLVGEFADSEQLAEESSHSRILTSH